MYDEQQAVQMAFLIRAGGWVTKMDRKFVVVIF